MVSVESSKLHVATVFVWKITIQLTSSSVIVETNQNEEIVRNIMTMVNGSMGYILQPTMFKVCIHDLTLFTFTIT